MRVRILIGCLMFGLLSQKAKAYESGVGIGHIRGCLARMANEETLCSTGPALSVRYGLNLWGAGYKPDEQEASGSSSGPSYSAYHGNGMGNFGLRLNNWEEVALVIVVGLLLTGFVYAFMYPFSSRLDVGVIGRSGWQERTEVDLRLWRNEAGLYMRAYLSQHFPIYIHGSGLFSNQNISLDGVDETHQVFVKGLGLGIMSPTGGGLYVHGVWERSSLIDPKPKDLVKDSGNTKFLKSSVGEILDGTNIELGYIWYL